MPIKALQAAPEYIYFRWWWSSSLYCFWITINQNKYIEYRLYFISSSKWKKQWVFFCFALFSEQKINFRVICNGFYRLVWNSRIIEDVILPAFRQYRFKSMQIIFGLALIFVYYIQMRIFVLSLSFVRV